MTEIPPNDFRPGLPPPQFRLSTMLLAVSILCVLFAVFNTLSASGGIVLILFVLAVLAHVAGNALGTRLRENGDTPLAEDGQTPMQHVNLCRRTAKENFAPTTSLSRRRALGWTILIVTCTGIIVGAMLGGYLLTRISGELSMSSIGFAILFCGAMGGFVTFLTSSFLKVTFAAFLQSHRDSVPR